MVLTFEAFTAAGTTVGLIVSINIYSNMFTADSITVGLE